MLSSFLKHSRKPSAGRQYKGHEECGEFIETTRGVLSVGMTSGSGDTHSSSKWTSAFPLSLRGYMLLIVNSISTTIESGLYVRLLSARSRSSASQIRVRLIKHTQRRH